MIKLIYIIYKSPRYGQVIGGFWEARRAATVSERTAETLSNCDIYRFDYLHLETPFNFVACG